MERTKTISVTITVDPEEEMFSVETFEGESGCTTSFGPTPIWSPWGDALRSRIGDEIVSWVELMSDEEE